MVRTPQVQQINWHRFVFFTLATVLIATATLVGTADPTVTRIVEQSAEGSEISEIYFYENMSAEEQTVIRRFQSGENVTVNNPSESHFTRYSSGEYIAVIENQSVTEMYIKSPPNYEQVGMFFLIITTSILGLHAISKEDDEPEHMYLFEAGLVAFSVLYAIWMVFL